MSNEFQSEELPFDITINRNFAHIVFDGEVNLKVVNQSFLELLNHPQFVHNMNVCNDYTNAMILVTMLELEEHVNFVAQYSEQRGKTYKLAMVSNETVSAAFLNLYRVRTSKSTVDSEIFGSTKAALRWLES